MLDPGLVTKTGPRRSSAAFLSRSIWNIQYTAECKVRRSVAGLHRQSFAPLRAGNTNRPATVASSLKSEVRDRGISRVTEGSVRNSEPYGFRSSTMVLL